MSRPMLFVLAFQGVVLSTLAWLNHPRGDLAGTSSRDGNNLEEPTDRDDVDHEVEVSWPWV